MAGVLVCFTILFPALLNPIIARYSEKRGYGKVVMLAGILILGLGTTFLSFSTTYLEIAGSTLLMGLGLGTYHPHAMSSLSMEYASQKGRVLGYHGVIGTVGFALTPLFIIFTHQTIGWRTPLHFFLIPSIFLILILWKRFQLIHKPIKRQVEVNSSSRRRLTILLATSLLLSTFASSGVKTFVSVYYISLNASFEVSNFILFLCTIATVLGIPIGGALSDKKGSRTVIIWSLVISIPFIVLFVLTIGLLSIISMIIFMFLTGINFPAFFSYALDLSGERKQASGVGFLFGTHMLSNAISPPLVGWLADIASFQTAFFTMALIMILSILPVLPLLQKKYNE